MDLQALHNNLITSFGLESLSPEDRDAMLLEIIKTVQKQFLLDVYDALGAEKFEALQTSANMGDQFYETTLRHLLPNHEELLQSAVVKVTESFKKGS
jgi:hypothetical protein